MKKNLKKVFQEVKKSFPFPNYINNSFDKYQELITLIMNEFPNGARILSIGSGPCDLEAMLSLLGYDVTAVDDLEDPWHKIGNNRERIKIFAKRMNINFFQGTFDLFKNDTGFDLVLLIDVIEHLHESPRNLLNSSITQLKDNGIIIIETPNVVSLKKRSDMLMGKNIQSSDFFYWNIGPFRSHVIEYTKSDLISILKKQDVQSIRVKMANIAINHAISSESNIIKRIIFNIYKLIVDFNPNLKDTIIVYGKKPVNWQPKQVSIPNLKKYYGQIGEYNLDNESNIEILKHF